MTMELRKQVWQVRKSLEAGEVPRVLLHELYGRYEVGTEPVRDIPMSFAAGVLGVDHVDGSLSPALGFAVIEN
jgi:hypothetical protein